MPKRLQITLRGILLATVWIAVAAACFTRIDKLHSTRTASDLEVPLTWLMLIAPFAATGALINRPILGLLVGVISVATFVVLFNLL